MCYIYLNVYNKFCHRDTEVLITVHIGSIGKKYKHGINSSAVYYELWGICTCFWVYTDTYFLYYNVMPQCSGLWGIKEFPVKC